MSEYSPVSPMKLADAMFAAMDLACDHNDVEIAGRLSRLIEGFARSTAPKPAARSWT